MMFIYKITEVKFCASLREDHDVIFAEMTLLHIRHMIDSIDQLILTDILLKFSQTNLKIMYIQKIKK